jgi:hypothetical protein
MFRICFEFRDSIFGFKKGLCKVTSYKGKPKPGPLCPDSSLLFRRFFNALADGDGHIRANQTACGTVDTIFRTRLIRREIPHRVDLFGEFQNVIRANGYAQPASFAPFFVDYMFIFHIIKLLIDISKLSFFYSRPISS